MTRGNVVWGVAALLAALLAGCVEDEGVLDGELEDPPDEVAEVQPPPVADDGADDGALEPLTALVPAWLDAEEIAFLGKLNAYRAGLGLGKVHVSIALTRAANFHANDMVTNGCFSHASCDGTDTFVRIKRFYAHETSMGEIIAAGYTTGAAAFTGWKDSPGHDAIMKGADYVVVGISRVAKADGTYVWVADFGGATDALFSAGFGTIVSNGGFETSSITTGVTFSAVRTLSRWHTSGSAVRSTSAENAGSYGLRETDPDPGAVAATQLVRASAGVNYRASAAVRRISGATGQTLYLDFLDKAYARIAVKTVGTGTATTWGTIKVEDAAPAGTTYVRVILYGSAASAKKSVFDWDSVKLEAF